MKREDKIVMKKKVKKKKMIMKNILTQAIVKRV